MNYILPLAFLMLIYNVVLGTEEIKNDEFTSDGASDDSLHRVRRGLNMLRLGRGLQMLRLGKRGIPMLRLGRSPSESLSNEEFQYILSLMRNSRQVPLPRYGKHLDFQYMLMNALANADQHPDWLGEDESDEEDRFPGFGYDLDSMPERQIRPIPRPGRLRYRRSADAVAPGVNTESSNAAESKQMDEDFSRAIRVAPLARYGKYLEGKTQEANLEANDDEKRTMRMLRLGRGMRMLRLGKRPDDLEQEEGEGEEEEKRALRLLRLGKRPYAMLRLGRGYNEEEKRALRLLRLGKRADGEDVEQGKFSNYGI